MFEITTTHYCSHMLRASSIEKLSLSCCRIDSRESTSKNTFQLNHTCVCYLGSWSFRLFSGTCCILTSCHKNHWTIKHNHSYMIHISFENSTNMNLKEDCFPQARKGGGLFSRNLPRAGTLQLCAWRTAWFDLLKLWLCITAWIFCRDFSTQNKSE